MSRFSLTRLLTTSLVLVAPALGGELAAPPAAPQTVSPGTLEEPALIRQICPTFSWASAATPGAFRVRVVEIGVGNARGEGGETDRTALETTLPGGARSWTPSASRCLERGKTYSWSVQSESTGELSEPSEDRRFRVSGGPSPEEIRWALDVLQRHLGPSAHLAAPGADPSSIGVRFEDDVTSEIGARTGRESVAEPDPVPADATTSPPGFEVAGLVEVGALRAVDSGAGDGGIHAEGDILLPRGGLSTPELRLTHQNYTTDGVRSDSAALCSPSSGVMAGGVATDCGSSLRYGFELGEIAAISEIRATGGMEVTQGSWTGDDGGSGVTYVPSYFYVPMVSTVVDMDENESICNGGGLVVGVRFWETDTDQIGLQVKCTYP